jgi:hypothetical protein
LRWYTRGIAGPFNPYCVIIDGAGCGVVPACRQPGRSAVE